MCIHLKPIARSLLNDLSILKTNIFKITLIIMSYKLKTPINIIFCTNLVSKRKFLKKK